VFGQQWRDAPTYVGTPASSNYDPQTEIRRVPAVFAQEEFQDWKAQKSRDFFFTGDRQTA